MNRVSVETAATMGFVAFAFLVIAMGLSARSETGTAFNRDILSDRNQVLLYGLARATHNFADQITLPS